MTARIAKAKQSRRLTNGHLLAVVATRMVINTAFRLVYPLLPFLAMRLQVDAATVNLLVTIQVTSGMLSLVGGVIADRIGDRRMMALGLLVYIAGGTICALAGEFVPFFLGYAVIGIGTAFYIPAAHSYVSHHTPYSRRARALGTVELGWSLAGIIGTPLLSRLVETHDSWTLAFVILGISATLTLAATLTLLPTGAGTQSDEATPMPPRAALRRRPVMAMAAALFLTMAGMELLLIVQSAWQQHYFGLSTVERGDLFGMIGFAELLGALSVALLVDRLGVRRAVIAAYSITALVYLTLPATIGHLTFYSTVFILFGLCFEFSIVASFPLLSELAPEARGTTIALGSTALAAGRAVGSAFGEPLWSYGGHWATGIAACGLTLCGVLVLVRYVHEAKTG